MLSFLRKTLRVTPALLRGVYYILFFRFFRRDVVIRFPFFAYADVTIVGEGSVFIDRNCSVYLNVFRGMNIATFAPEATVTIGKSCSLGGLAIRCRKAVTIDDKTMTAYSLIQDTFFADKSFQVVLASVASVFVSSPVHVGKNVWIGGQGIVLSGSLIGENSVVGAGSVCHHIEVNQACLASGNPVRRPIPIAGLMILKGQ